MSGGVLTADELEAALRAVGDERYHIHHPFHHSLHGGKLTRNQVQAWALNRYYYQASIPAKDATLMARFPTAEERREWRRRIEDHDGNGVAPGGIERWLKLAEGIGLSRAMVESTAYILPVTRFAVDAYVHFVRDRTLLEAVASSLTELFSPQIISERVLGMLTNYDWIKPDAGLLHAASQPGTEGQRLGLVVREGSRDNPGEAGSGSGRATLQVRRAVVAARRSLLLLCRPRLHPAGRFQPGSDVMTGTARTPSFRPGVKFRFDSVRDAWVLLAPEKLFLLDEIGVEILKLVDGTRSIDGIIDDLAARFTAPRAEIARDVVGALEDLSARGAVEL